MDGTLGDEIAQTAQIAYANPPLRLDEIPGSG